METGHYLIKLDQVLTDSMHGEMHGFEIVTARLASAGLLLVSALRRAEAEICKVFSRSISGPSPYSCAGQLLRPSAMRMICICLR